MLYEVLKRLGGIDLQGVEAILHREAAVRFPRLVFHFYAIQAYGLSLLQTWPHYAYIVSKQFREYAPIVRRVREVDLLQLQVDAVGPPDTAPSAVANVTGTVGSSSGSVHWHGNSDIHPPALKCFTPVTVVPATVPSATRPVTVDSDDNTLGPSEKGGGPVTDRDAGFTPEMEEWTDFGLDVDAAELPLSSLYPTPAPYTHGLALLGQLIP